MSLFMFIDVERDVFCKGRRGVTAGSGSRKSLVLKVTQSYQRAVQLGIKRFVEDISDSNHCVQASVSIDSWTYYNANKWGIYKS